MSYHQDRSDSRGRGDFNPRSDLFTTFRDFLTRIEEDIEGRPELSTITEGHWHANLNQYVNKWVKVSVADVVTDPMFTSFYELLLDLSECNTQNIRHIATFILIKLGTELLSTCIASRGSRLLPRLRKISRDIVNKVFNERYKDGSRFVRLQVMKELAIWFSQYCEAIAPNVMLRLVIDNLSDVASAVRLESVRILDHFVASLEEMPDYLRDMIVNKKSVLIQMTYEISANLSSTALTLLTNVYTLSPDLFTTEEHKSIMWNIYDPHTSTAKQAAKFFAMTFPDDHGNTVEKLDLMIDYFESFEFHPEIIGTVMYGEFEPLADYESIAAYLVESDDPVKALKYFKLVTHHAMCLIKDGTGPAAPKRKKRKVDNDNIEELKSNFVNAFSPHTQELLEKYDFEKEDDWAFTFRIFFKVYETLLNDQLPNP